uniref:Protein kinase domain-containing protein n=1 Tax=Mucochytrium quahogii TaxID=96639 RepID=A0A7S2WD84_9STRA|mmetsp:Transcript_20350/g.44179  ORF Transcript_20350/g.44179 Transcript_20350/m.44179 type:complete len:383 (+) Transcript_20350:618-1766(+)
MKRDDRIVCYREQDAGVSFSKENENMLERTISGTNKLVVMRLPRFIPALQEKNLSFPLHMVKKQKALDVGGNFARSIIRGRFQKQGVCIKEICADTEYYAMTELALLHYFDHENIIKFVGASVEIQPEGKRIFCVTEFMRGGTLADIVTNKKRQRACFETRVKLAIGAARGLAYIHSLKIMHRDIKSENIFVSSRTGNAECKLGDFGFARGLYGPSELQEPDSPMALDRDFTKCKRLRAQTFCGSDHYMAPEIILNVAYTAGIDVYSFGCVLIELCTGKLLSDNPQLTRLPENHFHFNREDVRACALPNCPTSLLELALHCIEYDSKDRLTPEECLQWLVDLSQELDTEARTVERIGAVRRYQALSLGNQHSETNGECCVIS